MAVNTGVEPVTPYSVIVVLYPELIAKKSEEYTLIFRQVLGLV